MIDRRISRDVRPRANRIGYLAFMLVMALAMSACGAFSDADDKVFSSNWRQPEPVEQLFLALATDIWSEKPCYLIHPDSMRVAGFNSRGTQVSYLRSTCFRDVAEATNNPALCDKVRSVSTFFLSGASLGTQGCLSSISGHSAVSRNLDMTAILELAGYDAARVNTLLVEAGRFSSTERAAYFRDNHPGIFWNEVRQYVIASPVFFDAIDTLPGFASQQDLQAMQNVAWRPRFRRDLPLPEERASSRRLPEFQAQFPGAVTD